MDQYEREEEALWRDYEEGRISRKEYDKEIRLLQSGYRDAAMEAAQRAYNDEMERW